MCRVTRLLVLLGCLGLGLGSLTRGRAQEPVEPQERKPAPLTPPFQSMKDQRSYAIGVNVGRSVKQDQLDLNLDIMFQGIKDALTDSKLALSDELIESSLLDIQQEMVARMNKLAESNLAKARAYLEANKKKPDIVTTRSGLQYRVLKSGKGPAPGPSDRVKVHYVGKLLSGEEFDNSMKRNPDPANLQVDMVIPGWTEALQKMRVGDRWQLFVPPELGYGSAGFDNLIGPNELLVFEIELLAIEQVEEVPAKRNQ